MAKASPTPSALDISAPAARRRKGAAAPSAALKKNVAGVLKRTFGLARLREGQEAVIHSVMEGHPTLAIMPTGAGKSLCYQVPAMMMAQRTVVVSPLIALMKDQCDKLNQLGIPAFQLNSALSVEDAAQAETAIRDGQAQIVFTTPERLCDPDFIALVRSRPVGLLVVDEAHCISQWGHDFRPAFLEIGEAVRQMGQPTVLALTATATDTVIADVENQLGLGPMTVINTGVYRPNLHYHVTRVTSESEKLSRTLEWVARLPGPGIVYTATIKAVESVYQALQAAGHSVTRYHGRLSSTERHANQDAFMNNAARVMVATNAFGLGIDKPDTRFVLHYQMPSGLDAYYQESGRCGRDGNTSTCVLLYLHSDKAIQRFFMVGRYPRLEELEAVYQILLGIPPLDKHWNVEGLDHACAVPLTKIRLILRLLREQKVVAMNRAGHLRVVNPALTHNDLHELVAAYVDKSTHDQAMLEQMVRYGHSGHCRWKLLLEHFGDDVPFETGCGQCDNCVAAHSRQAAAATPEASQAGSEAKAAPRPASPAFAPGQKVMVRRYGEGVVHAADAETVTVAFASGKPRCFLAAYVTAVETPQPAPRRLEGRQAALTGP
jgi:ATP-dependent DNA helicase RecQ